MIDRELLWREIVLRATRSSGKGGQNVNKVASKVALSFHPLNSSIFTEEEKSILIQKLGYRISNEGFLTVTCEEERSQVLNKQKAFEKLISLLERAFIVQKPRKATKRTGSSIVKRLYDKSKQGEKKQNRRSPKESL